MLRERRSGVPFGNNSIFLNFVEVNSESGLRMKILDKGPPHETGGIDGYHLRLSSFKEGYRLYFASMVGISGIHSNRI